MVRTVFEAARRAVVLFHLGELGVPQFSLLRGAIALPDPEVRRGLGMKHSGAAPQSIDRNILDDLFHQRSLKLAHSGVGASGAQ